jgi:predicted aminopeptidase
MIARLRWIRFFLNLCLFILLSVSALNYQTSVYLIYQAKGQLSLLLNTQSFADFEKNNPLSQKEKSNILLVDEIKKYSVDSLGYKPTKNFSNIYDQKKATLLWVITACKPYAFNLYEWKFPLVGRVSYKGFFRKELAMKEYTHLVASGYDVDLRGVSAWSTLGWLNDPLLSSMLGRSKGGLCNLLFHELFHATYYAANSVSFNENIASFVAHKATLQFLKSDSLALNEYVKSYNDNITFNNYMLRQINNLKKYYSGIQNNSNKYVLKLKAINQVVDSISHLPLHNKARYVSRRGDILKFKNAYFVDFLQYDSMQDSLEEVFNKIYRGNIEKLVQDLRLN